MKSILDDNLIQLGGSKCDVKKEESVDSFTQITMPDGSDEVNFLWLFFSWVKFSNVTLFQADNNGNTSHGAAASCSKASSTYVASEKNKLNPSHPDTWRITLNQFIGTAMSVDDIIEVFSRRAQIKKSIEQIQKNRRKCVVSVSG